MKVVAQNKDMDFVNLCKVLDYILCVGKKIFRVG